MSLVRESAETPAMTAAGPPTGLGDGSRLAPRGRPWLFDLGAVVAYLLGALHVTIRLWVDVEHRAQASNVADHGFFQFVLAHAAHSVMHLENPLFSHQLNVPNGVNMMANTSILGLAIPLTPVTVLFGADAAYVVLTVFALAATATAWYFVLSRHVTRSRWAAFVGAALCGFGPGFVSQANGHPNIAGQFMVPLILLQVVRLRDTARPVRTGLILGLLITYQAFVNEEVLLFAAVVGALMATVWAVSRRDEIRSALRPGLTGLAVAATLAGALLAYPLYFQFFGPQHYDAVPSGAVKYYSDLYSYVSYSTESLAGRPFRDGPLNAHPAEENSYLGWPLVVLAVALVGWLRGVLLARIAAVVAGFFAALSLGPAIRINGWDSGIPGPFTLVDSLPLIESVVPVRLALMVAPALGVLIAIGLDRVIGTPRSVGGPRWLWFAAFAAALVPLFPTPLPAVSVPAAPAFVTAGTWRQYVQPGQSVLAIPVTWGGAIDAQRWSAQITMDMPLASGYFLGPGPARDARAIFGEPRRPTRNLMDRIRSTRRAVPVTEADRQNIIADIRHWRAAVAILGDVRNASAYRTTVTDLLGEPRFVDGVWLWDLRPILNG